MKARYTLILFILSALTCWATPIEEANNAYKAKQYSEAITLYNSILNEGLTSPTLYYNLGNAYYRTHEYGQAILCYERALRQSPHDKDIQENLAIANSKMQDNITPLPQFAVVRWFNSLMNLFSATGWKIVILVLLALLGFCVASFLLSHSLSHRKATLISGIVAVLLLAISIIGATTATRRTTSHNEAIVLRTVVIVKGSPDSHSVDMFMLHEGSKVTLTADEEGWYKVRIADGNQGWVEASALGII